ncbi:fumarylacetoacetate hydrolase-like protein [Lentithecium fluviatile CBS 122367]|uniref:Fumarylacetoacetate hydrolase-like protein n=1 Tax=Lentithecium fluviatile CBS 122367 TaxID=1168545 RepID=A0A6G1JLD0_9PLEO|nr:fumarylacetoacetate hydrolase-like protein [Lentithecium fluviatile CBS 122367]
MAYLQASAADRQSALTNYVSYQDPLTGKPRIGHYDLAAKTIQPLSFISGTPIDSLYQVIEAGISNIKSSGNPFLASSTKILPPLTGRDVLCVGKNYAKHAREFNSSGFDSSDKVDQPSHPVIFTKRFTSIIADGEEIYPYPQFTQTADYEGEVGVIIGKPGFRVEEAEAMEYVWGYTIVNDMTARERQRDHKQFYIGKSPDTFCPMGPVAVPKEKLDEVLRVQTHVNGELRQDATTKELIFSIPYLIKTMSEGQTLMPGDVLATGTPAGVGIGRKPPVYLSPGGIISISVTGLGTLTNRMASPSTPNPAVQKVQAMTHLNATNTSKHPNPSTLTILNDKPFHYLTLGPQNAKPLFFIHSLGATNDFFTPLIYELGLQSTHSCHLFDLEGHGLSPTHPLSELSLSSFTADLAALSIHANIPEGATLIAHSLGCLIALNFTLSHPGKVSQLILLGPPPMPLPEPDRAKLYECADIARTQGMSAILNLGVEDEVVQAVNPLGFAALRMSLLGQDPEGYAKGCTAFADFTEMLDIGGIEAGVHIITHYADQPRCEDLVSGVKGNVLVEVVQDVESWHLFENPQGVAKAVKLTLKPLGSSE